MPRLTRDIAEAATALRSGGVVAMPTETVYGLAASVRDIAAIRRLFEIKQRPLFDPLIVHIADLAQKDEVVREWPALAQRLAERFWPGPMTLVLPKRSEIDPLITAGLDTVGLRMPRHEMARALIRTVGAPLAAPSANRFGRVSPTTADHVVLEFADEDLLILDGGASDVGLESSVIALDSSPAGDRLSILRPGFVTSDDLREALADWPQPAAIERASSPASPGQGAIHYRPAIPLVIIRETEVSPSSAASVSPESASPAPSSQGPAPVDPQLLAKLAREFGAAGPPIELRLDPSPTIAARTLYADLRSLSGRGAGFIFVRRTDRHSGPQWEAIWDRLERAATIRA